MSKVPKARAAESKFQRGEKSESFIGYGGWIARASCFEQGHATLKDSGGIDVSALTSKKRRWRRGDTAALLATCPGFTPLPGGGGIDTSLDWRVPYVGSEAPPPKGYTAFARMESRKPLGQHAVEIQDVSGGHDAAWKRSTCSRRAPSYAFGPRQVEPSPDMTSSLALTVNPEKHQNASPIGQHEEPRVDLRKVPVDVTVQRGGKAMLLVNWKTNGRVWPPVQAFQVEVWTYDLTALIATAHDDDENERLDGTNEENKDDPISHVLNAPLTRIGLFEVPGACRETTVDRLKLGRKYKVRLRALEPTGPWSAFAAARFDVGQCRIKPSRFFHNFKVSRNRRAAC